VIVNGNFNKLGESFRKILSLMKGVLDNEGASCPLNGPSSIDAVQNSGIMLAGGSLIVMGEDSTTEEI
jgi:hypothetical protein